MAKTKSSDLEKAIAGGTQDVGLGTQSVREGIQFEVFIVPKAVEGSALSSAELNKLRVGNGLGQHPSVAYGTTSKSPKAKASKGSK